MLSASLGCGQHKGGEKGALTQVYAHLPTTQDPLEGEPLGRGVSRTQALTVVLISNPQLYACPLWATDFFYPLNVQNKFYLLSGTEKYHNKKIRVYGP